VGGPWGGTWRDEPVAVPSREIKVFAEPESQLVCADEQVFKVIGKYRRTMKHADYDNAYIYAWIANE
jgi:hypothetical protein